MKPFIKFAYLIITLNFASNLIVSAKINGYLCHKRNVIQSPNEPTTYETVLKIKKEFSISLNISL